MIYKTLLMGFLKPLTFFLLFFDVKRLACLLQITLLVLKKTSFLKNTLSGKRCPPMNWRNPHVVSVSFVRSGWPNVLINNFL